LAEGGRSSGDNEVKARKKKGHSKNKRWQHGEKNQKWQPTSKRKDRGNTQTKRSVDTK